MVTTIAIRVSYLWLFFFAAVLLGLWLYGLRKKRGRVAFDGSLKIGLLALTIASDIVLLTLLFALIPYTFPTSDLIHDHRFELTIGFSIVLYVVAVAFGKRGSVESIEQT